MSEPGYGYHWFRQHKDGSTFIACRDEEDGFWYVPGVGHPITNLETWATYLGQVPRTVVGGGEHRPVSAMTNPRSQAMNDIDGIRIVHPDGKIERVPLACDIGDGDAANEPDQLTADRAELAQLAQSQAGAAAPAAYDPAAATYERLRDAQAFKRHVGLLVQIGDLTMQLAEAHATIALLRLLPAIPPTPAPSGKVHAFPANALRHTVQRIGLLVR